MTPLSSCNLQEYPSFSSPTLERRCAARPADLLSTDWGVKRCSASVKTVAVCWMFSSAVQSHSDFKSEAVGNTDQSHTSNPVSSGSWGLTKDPMMAGQYCLEKYSCHLLGFHLIPRRVPDFFPPAGLQGRGHPSSLVSEKFKTMSLYDLWKYKKWQLLSNDFKESFKHSGARKHSWVLPAWICMY